MLDNLILPRFGKLAVRELTMEDVRELHESVGASAPYRANRMLSLISAMFNFAMDRKWADLDPARSSFKAKPGVITRYAEESKQNWLKVDQLQKLDKVLGKSDGAEAIRLLVLTGARTSEVLQAKWSELDLEGARWNKPSGRTKQKVARHAPLSPQAITVIERVRKHKKSSVYLFPKHGDPTKPRTSVKSLWIQRCDVPRRLAYRV